MKIKALASASTYSDLLLEHVPTLLLYVDRTLTMLASYNSDKLLENT